jgi:hypothetical protein
MSGRRVDYPAWILNVVAWDGLLPVLIFVVPKALNAAVAPHRELNEWIAIMLPLGAFFVRIAVGVRHIRLNGCPGFVRSVQFVAIAVGVLALFLIDCLLILAAELPAGAMFATPVDLLCWAMSYAVYLVSMTVAMYPGRVPSPDG